MDAKVSLINGRISIIVKPNSKKTQIVSYDDARSAFRVDVAAPAEDNRANIEIIKFFSRLVGKRVQIIQGLTSKQKILQIK